MRSVHVVIEGVAPLLFNRMSLKVQENIKSGHTKGRAPTKKEIVDDTDDKLYQNGQGLYAPAKWLKASLQKGGGLTKNSQWIEGVVFPEEKEILFHKKAPDGYHEDWVRRPPKTGTLVPTRWPMLKTGWKLTFDWNVTDETFPLAALKQAQMASGLRYGIGDGRPEFGRFRVVEFTEK